MSHSGAIAPSCVVPSTRTVAGQTWLSFRSGRSVCFRCDARGDAIAFVQRIENVSFREAAFRLGSQSTPRVVTVSRHAGRRAGTSRRRAVRPVDTEVLAAALELYSNRLMTDRCGLDYTEGRGFGRALLERERIGFAVGGELVPYLAWRSMSSRRARRAGLLNADGREVIEGRIVFPEVRQGTPVWMIGRLRWRFGCGACRDGVVRHRREPASARGARTMARLYVVMDADKAGSEATARLNEALGGRVVPVALPAGVKDPGDLAARADGGVLFAEAVRSALATV